MNEVEEEWTKWLSLVILMLVATAAVLIPAIFYCACHFDMREDGGHYGWVIDRSRIPRGCGPFCECFECLEGDTSGVLFYMLTSMTATGLVIGALCMMYLSDTLVDDLLSKWEWQRVDVASNVLSDTNHTCAGLTGCACTDPLSQPFCQARLDNMSVGACASRDHCCEYVNTSCACQDHNSVGGVSCRCHTCLTYQTCRAVLRNCSTNRVGLRFHTSNGMSVTMSEQTNCNFSSTPGCQYDFFQKWLTPSPVLYWYNSKERKLEKDKTFVLTYETGVIAMWAVCFAFIVVMWSVFVASLYYNRQINCPHCCLTKEFKNWRTTLRRPLNEKDMTRADKICPCPLCCCNIPPCDRCKTCCCPPWFNNWCHTRPSEDSRAPRTTSCCSRRSGETEAVDPSTVPPDEEPEMLSEVALQTLTGEVAVDVDVAAVFPSEGNEGTRSLVPFSTGTGLDTRAEGEG